jgi:hypothetical protein
VVPATEGDLGKTIVKLLKVKIRLDALPKELNPVRCLADTIDRVLGATPATMHKDARKRRAEPVAE